MVTIAPALTRVHKLFRHRAILNELPSGPFKSELVSEILVKDKLSKKSILIDEDHMRRGRDHLHDLVSLGLVTRIQTQDGFFYKKNPISDLLKKYKFKDSCPRDLYEAAFFADCLARMKLDNPNYTRRTYGDFRCRHFLNILALLEYLPLHISQIQYARSTKEDLLLKEKEREKLHKIFLRYPKRKQNAEDDFIKSYFKTEDEKDEIARSSIPILRWLQQTGMIFLDHDNWVYITEKGKICLKLSSKYYPVWFDDLGTSCDVKAGLLIAYNIALNNNKTIDVASLTTEEKQFLAEIKKDYPFDKKGKNLKYRLCFDIFDSVSSEYRKSVSNIVNDILTRNKINVDLLFPIKFSINELYKNFSTTDVEKEFIDYERAFGLVLPRKESFQNAHEWISCVQLLQLGFKARPYNGEYEGVCDLRIAKDNPDIVLNNSFVSLAECKSVKEWGETLKLDKRVIGEFNIYQEYADDVDANSVIFVCESKFLDEDRYVKRFTRKSKLDKLIIINNIMLTSLKNRKNKINLLKDKIKCPSDYDMQDRILFEAE